MSDDTEKLRFRPRARIIRTIGDQLISGPEAAIIELVKNAYDADASAVTIKFYPPLVPGTGRITVQDDGHGMTLSDIQDKWMEPATTSKVSERVSPVRGRQMMGSKGIGRFAAAKLGAKLSLMSVSDRGGSRTEILIPDLDWSIFSGDIYLSDVAIDFFAQPTTAPTGTLLEVVDLNEAWPEAKVSRLVLELRRLLSPLEHMGVDDTFDIFLDLSECTPENSGFDGRTLLQNANASAGTSSEEKARPFQVLPFPLLTSCDYEVAGTFNSDGHFSGTFQNRRAGTGPETIELEIPWENEEESCGPVEVRLFLFDREADAVKTNMRNAGLGDLTATQARRILDNIAGVAIYRAGFRIRPYGDPENDWLTLDKRRVQNPSVHIGHNQVAGYITVSDQDVSGLVERSSREGFEQNGAYRRLARSMEELLTRVIEPKRYEFRAKTGISRSRTVTFEEVRKLSELEKLRRFVATLSPAERAEAEQLIDQQSSLLRHRVDQLEERARILEAKSSLGAILGEVLHEGAQPAAYIEDSADRLRFYYRDLLGGRGPKADFAKEQFEKKLPLMAQSGEKLATLFRNLKPLAGGKRGPPESFNVANTVEGVFDLFNAHDIEMSFCNPDMVMDLIGYRDDLVTALVNLIGNSIHWLEDSKTPAPAITVTVLGTQTEAIIYVDDNGPGVTEEFADLIFDVGFSLKSGGTGLGLNIAKEALARSDATLAYHMDFAPGSRFEIRFPRMQERQ